LGHCGEASARLTRKALGYGVIVKSVPLVKQGNNIYEDWKGDISLIEGVSFDGLKFWVLIVHDYLCYIERYLYTARI
jgi:hypothetical protein